MKRMELLQRTAQEELAEHDVKLAVEHLRSAATRYDAMGRWSTAVDLREAADHWEATTR